jgi:hypothetical protein
MLMLFNINKLVNAGTLSREIIYFNWVAILILLYSGIRVFSFEDFNAGIGIYRGLFHLTLMTHSFILFISIIGAIVLLLTAFNLGSFLLTAFLEFSIRTDSYIERYKKKLISKMGEQSVVIEYPLIIFFILVIYVIFLLLSVSLYLEDADGFVLSLVPVAIYTNAETQKELIKGENRGRAGVYR